MGSSGDGVVVATDRTAAVDVVGVVGGAGGPAAVVEDVGLLGERLTSVAQGVDEAGLAGALARAALDAHSTALLAPAASAAAEESAGIALARVADALASTRALAAATRAAEAAYAEVEQATTIAWHTVTLTAVTSAGGYAAPVLLAVSAGLHEIGHVPGSGVVEAAMLEVTLDGAAQLVDPVVAPPRAGAVEDSALSRATGVVAALTPPAEAVPELVGPVRPGIDPPTARPTPRTTAGYDAQTPGLAGLVDGVADATLGEEHVVAVRHRTLTGPDGRREAYVVDLAGTDAWDLARRTPSVQDIGSGLRQLGDAPDDAYVDAVLDILTQVPDGATVVLVGHSLGGITASRVAVESARRGRRIPYVVTAGAPVDTMTVPRGTTTVALQNLADPVPATDGRPARDVAGRTTVLVTADRGRATANHDTELYRDAARAADRRAQADAGLRATTSAMRRDGAIAGEGDVVEEEVTWWRLRRTR